MATNEERARTHTHHHNDSTTEEPRRHTVEHDQQCAVRPNEQHLMGGIGQWGVGEKDGERTGTEGLKSESETRCRGLQGYLALECITTHDLG